MRLYVSSTCAGALNCLIFAWNVLADIIFISTLISYVILTPRCYKKITKEFVWNRKLQFANETNLFKKNALNQCEKVVRKTNISKKRN